MIFLKRLSLIISLLSVSLTFAQEINKSKREKIKTLLELAGTTQRFDMVVDNFMELQSQYQDIDQKLIDEFKIELSRDGHKELYELIIPPYENNFTESEIDGLLEFFQSPSGRIYLEKLPQISQELMDAGTAWGEIVAKRVLDKITSYVDCEGYKKGTFKYVLESKKDWEIIRRGEIQIERNTVTGVEIKAKMNWTSDCTFILEINEVKNLENTDVIGNMIQVEILSSNTDKFLAFTKSENYEGEFELIKVSN